MKKTLLAAALLGSFAASAFAAPSVTLYGVVDTGLNYTHYRADDGKTASTDTFSEQSGQTASSRWGLRGDEKIGSVTVGFNLENGFNSDDGTEAMSRLFGREASVHVAGKYGTLYAGREGKLISTAGAAAMGGIFSPSSGATPASRLRPVPTGAVLTTPSPMFPRPSRVLKSAPSTPSRTTARRPVTRTPLTSIVTPLSV